MSDFDYFAASVSRTELLKPVLDLNDHRNYIVNDELLGGTTTWNRQTAKSPYVDGEFTVGRTKAIVEEQISIECLGATSYNMQVNIGQLIEAFTQSIYVFTVRIDTSVYSYKCEAADYTVGWDKSRRMAQRATVKFMVRRQPTLMNGGF